MVLACGCLCFSSVLYHLVNHDSIKALLFLSAESLIHGFNRSQVRVKPLASGDYRNQFISSVESALISKVVMAPTVHEAMKLVLK